MEDQTTVSENNTTINNNIDVQKILSIDKFIILSIMTFSLYQLWWMYKTWRFFKQKEQLDIYPAMRALFSIFFLTSLFREINDYALEKGYTKKYNSVLLFLDFYFLLVSLPT
ncbi:MAG: DUF4234 domain-containing protein [Cyclobacteriaceae bacterium]